MKLLASTAIFALLSGSALAAEPSVVGDWLVKDGYGHVRIDNCDGKMWGIVSWEKTPGFDNENTDPAKKGRPRSRTAWRSRIRTPTQLPPGM